MPYFSIVIATYNRAGFIKTAITSVLEQTIDDWELIIVDDGSTDNTENEILPFLKDSRIKYFWQKNQERSVARNHGISLSKGEYICFLDSDDFYLPHHLLTFKEFIRNNKSSKLDIFTVNRSYKRNHQQEIIWFDEKQYNTFEEKLLFRAILDSPPIQCICIHRSFFLKVQFKNDWLPFAECNHLSFDLLSAGYTYRLIPTHSVVMVNHDNNSTIYSYPFIKKKLEFVETFSRRINLHNNPAVINNRFNALLGLADTSLSSRSALQHLAKAISLNPKSLTKRQVLGITKKIILGK